MKKRLLTVAFLMGIWGAYAQVGIGTTAPNKSSQLEIVAKDRGILIPQVPLKGVTDTATIKNGNVTSLLVWNTSSLEDVSPGYYYWNHGKWMRIVDTDTLLELDTNTTNTSLTVVGDALVLTDSDGNTVSIPLTAINLPTTLANNGDGSYTYTSENGTTTTIDVPADVINNFYNIVNNGDVLQELITVLGDTYVGGNVYYDGEQFTYVDQDGDSHVINLKQIVQANETVTTLVNNEDGTYTYTNEAGDEVIIDVPADVISNFHDIVNNGDVLQELITVLGDTYVGGNVYYDGEQFTYVDQDGESHIINLKKFVQDNETVTKLVTNANGTYTYFNEIEIDIAGNPIAGTGVTIDIPASVIQNFEDIINNTAVKNKLFETIHNSYVGGNVYYNGTKFTYVTVDGEIKDITFKEIVKANETVTHLIANTNGTFTYYNEEDYAEDGSLKVGAVGVIIDPSLVNVTKVGNKYVFKNNEGDLIVELEYNADDIVYNDSVTNLGATNVQNAIELLLNKIETVEGTKGTLTVDGSITLDDGVDVLLKNAAIKVAEKGIKMGHLDTKSVTSEKLDAGIGTDGRIGVADATGTITYQSLEEVVQANQKTVSVEEGTNIAVTPVITNNHTTYTLGVATASGSSLGVVKEAASAPTVAINSTGELSVNLTNLNAIKEVSTDYTVVISDAILLGNANVGDLIITLPTAAAENKGKKLTIKKQDNNEDFYVHVSGSINGLTELYTALPHSGWDLVSDGTTWKIVNKF